MKVPDASLGLKLNLALLVFVVVLGLASSAIILYGFSRTQDNATERSREALEQQGQLALLALAGGVTDAGVIQFESAAAIGQRASRYLQDYKATSGTPPYDASQFVRLENGVAYDPNPNRRSDVVVVNHGELTGAVLDDIAYTAALDSLYPALIEPYPGEFAGDAYRPIAMTFVGVSGVGRIYPPIGVQETTAPEVDVSAVEDAIGPVANPERETKWTVPYEDAQGRGLVMTARTPVYEGDTFRGMFEVDLSIGRLAELVNTLKPTETGFTFYVDSEGSIMQTSAFDLLNREAETNTALADILTEMSTPVEGREIVVKEVTLEGREYFIAYNPMLVPGGSLAVAAPVDEVTDQAAQITAGIEDEGDRTFVIMLVAMAALFVVGLIGATYLNRRLILAPLSRLIAGTRAVAAGDLDTRVELDRGDELGALADSFNAMVEQLRESERVLERRVEERTQELGMLLDVSRTISSAVDFRSLVDAILREMKVVMDYSGSSVTLFEGDGLRIVESIGPTGREEEIVGARFAIDEDSQWVAAIRRGDPVVIGDVHSDEQYAVEYRAVIGDAINLPSYNYIRAWIGIPLMAGERVTGMLSLSKDTPDYFTERHVELAMAVARQAAVAAHNVELFEQTKTRTQELSTLLEVSRSLASNVDFRGLAREMLKQLKTVVDYTGASVAQFVDDGLRIVEATGPTGDEGGMAGLTASTHVAQGWYELVRAGETIVVDDVRAEDDPLAQAYRRTMGPLHTTGLFSYVRSWMAVPLRIEDEVIGMLMLVKDTPGFFTQRHAELTEAVASHGAVAAQNARLFEQTQSRTREMAALLEISRSLGSTLELTPLLEGILDQLRKVVPYSGAGVDLVVDGSIVQVVVRRPAGYSTDPAGADPVPVTEMSGTPFEPLVRGDYLYITDVLSDDPAAVAFRQTWGGDLKGTNAEWVRALLLVPMFARGQLIGLLTLGQEETGVFTNEHIQLVQSITRQAAAAIENARLYEETQRRARETEALLEVSGALASTLELRPLLERILDELRNFVDYAGASVNLLRDGMLYQLAVRRPRGPEVLPEDIGVGWPANALSNVVIQPGSAATIISDVHGDSEDAIRYRAMYGGSLEGTRVEFIRSFMSVPLISRGELVGVLSLSHDEPGFLRGEHARLLQPLADQAAVAIENARLYEETQRRARETEALLEVARGLSSTLEIAPLLDLLLEQLSAIVPFDGAAIHLLEGDSLQRLAARSNLPDGAPVGGPVLGTYPLSLLGDFWRETIQNDQLLINDTRDDSPQAVTYRQIWGGDLEGTPVGYQHSLLAIPLRLRDQAIGMLVLGHREKHHFKEEDIALTRAVSAQAATAIENARLYEETRRRARETEALLNVAGAVVSTLNLRELMAVILEQTGGIIERAGTSILTVEGDDLLFWDALTGPTTGPLRGARIPLAVAGPIWQPISRGEVVIIDDVKSDHPMAQGYRQVVGATGLLDAEPLQALRSWMGVPLAAKGRVFGMLTMSWTEPAYFTEDHARLARAFADQAALAIENARLYESSQQVAALEERQRLARELHDSVSQALYGIALGARTARTLLDRDAAQAVEPVDYVLSLAEAGLAEMRSLIFELRPESLANEGLVVALQKQIAATQARYGIAIDAQLEGEPEIALDTKEALYRIGQEALHNVVKHARAANVAIVLASENGNVCLSVTDDGVGFDPEGDFAGHLGLKSMRERMAAKGGTVNIESKPGAGTTVQVTVRAKA